MINNKKNCVYHLWEKKQIGIKFEIVMWPRAHGARTNKYHWIELLFFIFCLKELQMIMLFE